MRGLVPFMVTLAFGASVSIAPAIAQDATPAGDGATFADALGLPELEVTLTEGGFEGLPEETAAGRYVVTFSNDTDLDAGVDFVRLPEGKTIDDLGAVHTIADGSAAPGEEGDPLAELAWLYETHLSGGVGVGPGGSGRAIVDLPPGDYGVWSDDPTSPIAPVPLAVTGELPADLPEPDAEASIIEVGTAEGYAFELAGDLAPGPQTIRIDNKSDQPHFVVFIGSPGADHDGAGRAAADLRPGEWRYPVSGHA